MNNLGTAALVVDDEVGVELLENSLSLSLEAGLGEHAARAYTNLGSKAVMHRRYEAAVRTLDTGIGIGQVSVQAVAGWSSGAMCQRYVRALSAELAIGEFRTKRAS